jgi:predicted transcriptional regulator
VKRLDRLAEKNGRSRSSEVRQRVLSTMAREVWHELGGAH